MTDRFEKGKSLAQRAVALITATGGLITSITVIAGAAVTLFFFFFNSEEIPSIQGGEANLPGPVALACDANSEPVTQRLAGGLARLDCDINQIRICDFQDSAKSAAETSHGMESHLMQVSAELSDKRFSIIGNGRGAQAEQLAFDNLYNNLILVLEENNLCR